MLKPFPEASSVYSRA